MSITAIVLAATLIAGDPSLAPGDHERSLKIGEETRSYVVHVPPKCDPKKPMPVVLAFHGAAMTGWGMAGFSGLDDKADEAGFVVVYPHGTGITDALLTWNAGGLWGDWWIGSRPDDVQFTARLLDDLATVIAVDPKRVYATGLSNGAMMCYRLAAELSDRIAAIAPVAGTMVIDKPEPKRPVPVMHFHGTADKLVPFNGPAGRAPRSMTFKSVEESIAAWVKIDACPETPQVTKLPDKVNDGMPVEKKTYGPGKDGCEVILWVVEGGGHTWPGMDPPVKFIGKSTKNISANDLIWEFFQRHPMK